jgi:Trk-type K+ transport system membrane component
MNYKMVLYNLGRVVAVEGVALLLPLITALLYGEWTVALAFVMTIVIAFAIGVICSLVFKPKDGTIYSGEGFITVALAWIVCRSSVRFRSCFRAKSPHTWMPFLKRLVVSRPRAQAF